MRKTHLPAPLLPLALLAASSLVALNCGPSTPPPNVSTQASETATSAAPTASAPPSTSASVAASASAEKPAPHPHWGYHADHGPVHWGDLSAEWATCKTGTNQSPIDIVQKDAGKAKDLKALEFGYKPFALSMYNNGHTLQAASPAGNTLKAAGDSWDLVQFHFHAPSEHLVDGKHFDAEMHLVHKNAAGALAVVGVLLKVGKENKSLAPLFENATKEHAKEPKPIEGKTIDLAPFAAKKAAYYTYAGSLTTPPCSEGVTWIVLSNPAEISEAQLKTFKDATHGETSRPMQPMGSRKVTTFK